MKLARRPRTLVFSGVLTILLPTLLWCESSTSSNMQILRQKANEGDASSQFELGVYYATGVAGLPQQDTEAVRWYSKAAEQGDPTAQAHLGLLYDLGRGVAQDDAQAMRWYLKAAEQGESSAE